MSTLIQIQPLVDSVVKAFLSQFERTPADRDDQTGYRDFVLWLQYFVFDVIGDLTFSKRSGCLERGEDVDGAIDALERLSIMSDWQVGQMPIIDKMFVKNPLRLWVTELGLINTNTPVAEFVRALIAERNALATEEEKSSSAEKLLGFLPIFQEAYRKDPDFISQQRVLALTMANMFAESDTTAIPLRIIFYSLPRQRNLQRNLLEVIETHNFFSGGLAKWSDVQELPYLNTVNKEAHRCRPATGLVPVAGVEICGHHLPAETITRCNGEVVHQDKAIFGAQRELFRLERWIESTEEQRTDMNNALLSFGASTRSCIAKNISLLET
ncbi:hypothetical protein NX059_002384 [Plenodomus lindquistii]|nr:hypothetical protein NX059_002384 [Plenodomus lindquistii]